MRIHDQEQWTNFLITSRREHVFSTFSGLLSHHCEGSTKNSCHSFSTIIFLPATNCRNWSETSPSISIPHLLVHVQYSIYEMQKQPYGTTISYLLQVGNQVEPIKRTIPQIIKPKPTQHLNSSSPGSCSICHIWNADWYKNQKPIESWDSGRISEEKKP